MSLLPVGDTLLNWAIIKLTSNGSLLLCPNPSRRRPRGLPVRRRFVSLLYEPRILLRRSPCLLPPLPEQLRLLKKLSLGLPPILPSLLPPRPLRLVSPNPIP